MKNILSVVAVLVLATARWRALWGAVRDAAAPLPVDIDQS
jgi:hypothetical protein